MRAVAAGGQQLAREAGAERAVHTEVEMEAVAGRKKMQSPGNHIPVT